MEAVVVVKVEPAVPPASPRPFLFGFEFVGSLGTLNWVSIT